MVKTKQLFCANCNEFVHYWMNYCPTCGAKTQTKDMPQTLPPEKQELHDTIMYGFNKDLMIYKDNITVYVFKIEDGKWHVVGFEQPARRELFPRKPLSIKVESANNEVAMALFIEEFVKYYLNEARKAFNLIFKMDKMKRHMERLEWE